MHHLQFFAGRSTGTRRTDLRNQIGGDQMGENALGFPLPRQPGGSPLLHLARGRQTATADGLVGADDHTPHAGSVVERLHHHHHLGGRAVGAGDDARVGVDRPGVYLGDHQWHSGLHPKESALVDHHRAPRHRPGNELRRDFVRRAADGDGDPIKRFRPQHLNVERNAPHLHRLSGRALRGEQLDMPGRKLPGQQHFHDDSSHGASCANDCNRVDHARFSEIS